MENPIFGPIFLQICACNNKKIRFWVEIFLGYMKVHMGLLFQLNKKIATVRVKKSFSSLAHEKIFWSKTFFMPTMQMVEKYFFPTIFFINKKVAQCAL
jgi:hypothetical protein